MKRALKQIILSTVALALFCLAGAGWANAQTQPPPQAKELLSDQAFKNIKSLKGIPVDEFMSTMGFFSASLAENCFYCHVLEAAGDWSKWADDNDHKVMARRMIAMVNNINKNYFNGRREITCYSCHRGGQKPKVTPSLVDLYGPVPPDDTPDAMVPAAPKGQAPDKIIDAYLQAIGGTQKLGAIRSFAARGIYQGFADERVPFEEYAAAPNQRVLLVHGLGGDETTAFNGTQGWLAGPSGRQPIPVVELTGGFLDGARMEAAFGFPAGMKQALTQWRTLLPTTINDKDVDVVQGTINGKFPINLYFDQDTHLLVRSLRFADSPVGLTPTQIDYSDYRDVNGVKFPFKRTLYWVDGRSIIETAEIQTNVTVDSSRFGKPPVPETKRVKK